MTTMRQPRERAARERLVAAFDVIWKHQAGKALPKRDIDLAYRRFNAAIVRRHPDLDPHEIKWSRRKGGKATGS